MNSMQDDFAPLRSRSQPQRSGISARAVLGTSVLAFIGGALVVGWLVWNGRIELPREKAPVQAAATLPPPAATTDGKTAPPVDARVLGWEQRVSGLEQRLARLDLQAAATEGNTSRAVDYLLAAVQQSDATPAMWFALAKALRDNRQPGEAIQVLETCIRLDGANVEALFMLHELAEAAGATEIARDVFECLKQAAPEDPRVLALS